MHLIDHHETQVLEELRPLGVMGEHTLVKHVRVGHHNVAAGTHGLARVAGGVAVEGKRLDPQLSGVVELIELRHLILGQGLGRKQIHGLGLLADRGLQYRQVVTQGFARCGGRHHHDVPTCNGCLPSLCLMRVESADTTRPQGPAQPFIQVLGK